MSCNDFSQVKIFQPGDRVFYQVGAPIGVILEVDFNQSLSAQKCLVKYSWGRKFWYDSTELTKTSLPITKH